MSQSHQPPTMRALVLDRFESEPTLRTVPRPVPEAGEVLIQIAASGVNPLDTKIKAGQAAHAGVMVPAILGMDLAGLVVDAGPGATRFTVGDAVYGMTGGIGDRPGSLAEYAAVDEDLLALKPQSIGMLSAAALPLATITAWEGLVDRANVRAGQAVLVHGGSGGVGSIAVQIAVAKRAEVFATGSGDGLEVIRSLGAEPVDYRHVPAADYVAAATGGEGFDIVFDTIGGATLDASFDSVRPYSGHVVSILGWGQHSLAPLSFRGASYSGVFTLRPILTGRGRRHHADILAHAAALVDAGQLAPILHPDTYTLESITAAHRLVETGTAHGKVIIDIIGAGGQL